LPAVILKTCHTYVNPDCTILRIIQNDGFTPGVYKRCRQSLRSKLPSLLEIEAISSSETMLDRKPLRTIEATTDADLPLSHICVPIRHESRMLGTLTFFGKRADDGNIGKFNGEDLEFFGNIAKVIASALAEAAIYRNMTLFAAENDRKQKELFLLFRISNSMHSAIKLNELMHFTLNALVAGVTPIFERVMLFLVNERAGIIQGMQGVASDPAVERKATAADENPVSTSLEFSEEEMTIQRDSSFSRMVKETRIPLDESLNVSSRAVLEKKLIYITDVRKEKQGDRKFAKLFGLKTFAVVPLMVKGNPVGLVIVDNSLTGRSIAREDLLFLQLLMNQAGTAIENSMLNIRIEDAHRDFREIQKRLIQGEKLAAIGEMAASIAHELKGPLVSIGGFAKRLERKFAADSTEHKYAETIVHEVGRLEKMLSDTLFFSKKATICYSPCNIKNIVDESLAILAGSLEDKNIRVKVRFYPGIPSFLADCQQLKQVILNLLSNAAESMKNGGTLSTTIATTKLDGDAAISISISDTGGGIPVEILNDIFNPFFTTKECGTGLGLPISHKIVTNHGGRILVHNNPGVGVQFKVILPLHQCIPSSE
jgi:signal transduction histidine kinase